MSRRLVSLGAIVSAVVFLATVALWVRGTFFSQFDQIWNQRPIGKEYGVISIRGKLVFLIVLTTNAQPDPSIAKSPDQSTGLFYTASSNASLLVSEAFPSWPMPEGYEARAIPRAYQTASGERFGMEVGWARTFNIPLWLIAAVSLLLPGYELGLLLKARTRRPGFCPTCGYDLRATPDRCPECGTKTDCQEDSPKGKLR